MAHAAAKYVLAALLALLCGQAATPSLRVAASIEIVCCVEGEQQVPKENSPVQEAIQVRLAEAVYVSRSKPEPDSTVLFQRPPPTHSLFS